MLKSSSETGSSFEGPIEGFRPSPEVYSGNILTDKVKQQEGSKDCDSKHNCRIKDERVGQSSEERDSVQALDKILKSCDSQKKQSKVSKIIKNVDDGNSSDSSSNA